MDEKETKSQDTLKDMGGKNCPKNHSKGAAVEIVCESVSVERKRGREWNERTKREATPSSGPMQILLQERTNSTPLLKLLLYSGTTEVGPSVVDSRCVKGPIYRCADW